MKKPYNPDNTSRDDPKAVQIFEKLCRDHDLTYSYSDDAWSWRKGAETYEFLRKFAKDNLSDKTAARIWNKMVDDRISSDRKSFYWRD